MRVKSIRAVGGANVVAVTTESGWYETKAGLSHNCDDL